jgi:hypothetical protein
VLAFAALGHCAFGASLGGNAVQSLWSPLVRAAPNVLVLACLALARPKSAWLRLGPTVSAVVGSTLAPGALALADIPPGGDIASKVAGGIVRCACGGILGGLMGATGRRASPATRFVGAARNADGTCCEWRQRRICRPRRPMNGSLEPGAL